MKMLWNITCDITEEICNPGAMLCAGATSTAKSAKSQLLHKLAVWSENINRYEVGCIKTQETRNGNLSHSQAHSGDESTCQELINEECPQQESLLRYSARKTTCACVRACVRARARACGENNCVYKHEEAVCVIRQTSICDLDQYSLSRSNVLDFHPNHLEDYFMY